jgi:hypothetical protein
MWLFAKQAAWKEAVVDHFRAPYEIKLEAIPKAN